MMKNNNGKSLCCRRRYKNRNYTDGFVAQWAEENRRRRDVCKRVQIFLSINGNIVCSIVFYVSFSTRENENFIHTTVFWCCLNGIWDKCGREVNGEKLLITGWFKRFSHLDVWLMSWYSWCTLYWISKVRWHSHIDTCYGIWVNFSTYKRKTFISKHFQTSSDLLSL